MYEVQAISSFRTARTSDVAWAASLAGKPNATATPLPGSPTPDQTTNEVPLLGAQAQQEGVVVSLSGKALNLQAVGGNEGPEQSDGAAEENGEKEQAGEAGEAQKNTGQGNQAGQAGQGNGANGLTSQEERVVQELKARDQEVHAHEAAHKAAGGRYAGAPSYSYTTGPDNKQYATGGEVSIDVSPVPDNPSATISKMQTVRAAALAPAQPSGADMSVAAAASRIQSEAAAQLAQERIQKITGGQKQ
jgi:hypothetical protein